MKIFLSIILCFILITNIISTIIIVIMIEKHSIHPVHARQIENASYKCSPWDAC